MDLFLDIVYRYIGVEYKEETNGTADAYTVDVPCAFVNQNPKSRKMTRLTLPQW